MKIYDKKLAYPYFVWMVLFTVVPLFIVVYYALTDSTGSFTLDNLVIVSGYGSVFARSLLLALVLSLGVVIVIALVLAVLLGGGSLALALHRTHDLGDDHDDQGQDGQHQEHHHKAAGGHHQGTADTQFSSCNTRKHSVAPP